MKLPRLAYERARRIVGLHRAGTLSQADALRQIGDVMRMDGVDPRLLQDAVDDIMGDTEEVDPDLEAEVFKLWKDEELP